ncbi:MAG: peptidase M20, partial [Silanimonas sp.]
NEFLHIPTGKRVTQAVAQVIAEHYEASQKGLTRGVGVAAGGAEFGNHGCC